MINQLTSPSQIKSIMKKHNVRFSKSLGQNFIINDFIIDEIIRRGDISEEDSILEIGPGIGVLTQALAETAHQVIAVELDNKLIPILNETLEEYDNVKIIHNDILKIDVSRMIEEKMEKPTKVVANLPYYITTPIIMKLIEEVSGIEEIIVMVQKEVAERMVSEPGTKDYGSLSVAVQYYCDAMIILEVPRDNFMPAPNVDSAVIRLIVKDEPTVNVLNEAFFFKIIKGAFALRRKTLINSLSKSAIGIDKELLKNILEDMNIDLRIRGEKLDINDFAELSNRIYKETQN
ncbi:MAG TPA: 16S rRNA (adenine(1518)-N(6)/adenine(1519)-N(6))-dimethyltransferase RsmA [Clostridia bacterium]|nr:16S rRNA (adenine(1518)-N(6)/adenine(1519)-N(6))-dimethyltransferase RsmA [Clostridia bacterium]